MLYLPPNIAHYGIALNECMTCSVGFRAPSFSNMVSEYAENLAANIDQALRYEDPDLACTTSPAEISPDALKRIRSIIAEQLIVDDQRLVRWFGEFSSESRSGMHTQPPESPLSTYDELAASLTAEDIFAQSPAVKFLFARNDGTALLFVDGASYTTSQAFASAITDKRENNALHLIDSVKDRADQQTLLELYNRGYLLIQ